MNRLFRSCTLAGAALLGSIAAACPADAGNYSALRSWGYRGRDAVYGSYRYHHLPSWYGRSYFGGVSPYSSGYGRYYSRSTGTPTWYTVPAFPDESKPETRPAAKAPRPKREKIVLQLAPPETPADRR
jgi:hypothetical protein